MRLIDWDKVLEWMHRQKETMEQWSMRIAIENYVDDMPTVDAVPVIRCKDCVFWKNYCRVVDGVESDHVCSKKRELDGLMHRTNADDFCSWAERKEE